MAKSLTETAKSVLMKEGMIPSTSTYGAGDPDRGAMQRTPNMATLKPGGEFSPGGVSPSYTGRFANPPGSGPNVPARWTPPDGQPEHTETQPVTDPYDTQNIGAVVSKNIGKDTSRSGQSTVAAEPYGSVKKSPTAEVMEEEFEISEELEAFVSELMEQGLSEEEIAEAIEENFELVSEEKDEDEKDEDEDDEDKKKMKESSHMERKEMVKEHVNALLAGENLSEDFRAKAETIFESAVATRVEEEVQTLEEAYAAALEEEVAKIHEQLTEQVDDYLNYVVEQWVAENEVAIETGLRTELTEEFISGLRTLFAEHYIDIPEEKVTVVESLGSKVEELEAKLNEEIDRNVGLTKQLNESRKFEVLVDACDGLTDTQASKLRSLAENIEFTNADEYSRKVETLRESYFPSNVDSSKVLDLTEETDGKSFIAETTQGPMAAYVKALGKSLPK